MNIRRLLRKGMLFFLLPIFSLFFALSNSQAAALVNDFLVTEGVARSISVDANDLLVMRVTAGRSYSCEAISELGKNEVPSFSFSSTVVVKGDLEGGVTDFKFTGDMAPAITAAPGNGAQTRISFTPELTGRAMMTVATANADEDVLVRCYDSTLYGGFNTNANEFNFLELTNVSTDTIKAKVTAVNFDATFALDREEIEILPGKRVDVSLHDAAGSNKFGTLEITHDGPRGALKGNVSMYFGDVSTFRLGGVTELKPSPVQ